jgi:predicted NBD/HSP70 family sugar kinase
MFLMRDTKERGGDSAALAVMRAVHDQPGVERASLPAGLGLASGFVAETVARLVAQELLIEGPAARTGGRGRPTTTLHPHPRGPLVITAAIAHETWRLAVVEVGGTEVSRIQHSHERDATQVLTAIEASLRAARRRHGSRVRAIAIAVPGTVSGNKLVQAANLDWHDVDLADLWSHDREPRPILVGNDATFAAVAESRRGVAVGAEAVLHLYMDAGVGGAVIDHGHLVSGAGGTAGEFGHVPFGDPGLRCRCGAYGCWNTTLDGFALSRLLAAPPPRDEVSYMRAVIGRAKQAVNLASEGSRDLYAVTELARSVGRGTAGLVNAFDPDLVTLGGVAAELLEVAEDAMHRAYLAGLMQHRITPPPRIVAAMLGDDAPLIGGAEEAMATVLSDDGLRRWVDRGANRQSL